MQIEKIKQAKTSYIGKQIKYYDTIDSTQEEAKRNIKQEKNGTIFIAGEQLQGKGTKGRTWYSSKDKNILMTILLYPNCDIAALEGFTIQVAEIMKQTVEQLYDITLKIKEPNDLLLNGKKIAGILIESSSYQNHIRQLLIGIGLNVNEVEFSEATLKLATSLKKEFGKEFKIEEIIITFIEKLEVEINKICEI